MKLKPYLTEYRAARGALFGADIWARSWTDAVRLAARRGLGEKVLGQGVVLRTIPASRILRSRRPLVEKFHALVWLGLLASYSKVASPAVLFDDAGGILHMFCHYELFGRRARKYESGPSFKEVLRAVKRVERLVPGYPPRAK